MSFNTAGTYGAFGFSLEITGVVAEGVKVVFKGRIFLSYSVTYGSQQGLGSLN